MIFLQTYKKGATMAVLIKDMQIPENCQKCPFVYDSSFCMITGERVDEEECEKSRLDSCPLIPIEEKEKGE